MIISSNHFTKRSSLKVKALLRRTQSTTVEQSEPHARDVIEFKHLEMNNDTSRTC